MVVDKDARHGRSGQIGFDACYFRDKSAIAARLFDCMVEKFRQRVSSGWHDEKCVPKVGDLHGTSILQPPTFSSFDRQRHLATIGDSKG